MALSIATVMAVGLSMGNTTRKKVWRGLHPSIVAASSISSGTPLTNPVNMNTESPAPKPRYTRTIPATLSNASVVTMKVIVYMTIWNGTIMLNTKI